MKSYYGNLVVDVFGFLLAFASCFFVCISSLRDSSIFFAVTALIYLFSRVLDVVCNITYYSRDSRSLISNIISLSSLLFLFLVICIIFYMYFRLKMKTISLWVVVVYFIASATSLFDLVVKVFYGIKQKFLIIKVNEEFILNKED